MYQDVTQAQRARFAQDGYLHIPAFLDPEELALWRTTVDGAVANRVGGPLDGTPAGRHADAYANVFIQAMLLARKPGPMQDIIYDPRLGKLAADLADVDGIHVWHDQALIKEPLANPTAFHRDVPFWSFDSHQAISLWVALDDADLSNGCLYFLPGSQSLTDFKVGAIGENIGALVNAYPALAGIPPVAVPATAGDAIYIDGMVAHGAGPNMTLGYRRAMTCAYMPVGARFNGKRNILTDRLFRSLAPGDLLNDPIEQPLIYSRP